jgi:L-fuculose-phosphate aldolase
MKEYKKHQNIILSSIKKLNKTGFLHGTGGNLSIRIPDEQAIAITPSQMEYNTLKREDICIIDFDLNPIIDNGLKPSMESGMHIAIYKTRKDTNAVLHTHQKFASIFSLINHPIPPLFDEVAMNIGNIVEIIPHAFSGSKELANNVSKKVSNRLNCFIIQNHGAISLGTDINNAMINAELLEKNAEVYYYALSTGKEISILPENIQKITESLFFENQKKSLHR